MFQNRFEVLRHDENQTTNSSTLLKEKIDIDTNVNVHNKPHEQI